MHFDRRIHPGTPTARVRVERAFRRCGIGARLLHELAALAASHGVDEIVLRTRPDNLAALGLTLTSGLPARAAHRADPVSPRMTVWNSPTSSLPWV